MITLDTLDTLARIAVGWLVLSVIVLGAYVVAMARLKQRRAVVVTPRSRRDDEEIRQPDDRSWICSDGNMRTAAEAADWCAATPGSDAYWLDAWIFGETVPDYVPQGWVA